jgi:hypothetical protein
MTHGDEAGAAPYASGGGATVLEHTYGAVLLASLLTGAAIPELGDDATPDYLRFQARPASAVDDLLVPGKPAAMSGGSQSASGGRQPSPGHHPDEPRHVVCRPRWR